MGRRKNADEAYYQTGRPSLPFIVILDQEVNSIKQFIAAEGCITTPKIMELLGTNRTRASLIRTVVTRGFKLKPENDDDRPPCTPRKVKLQKSVGERKAVPGGRLPPTDQAKRMLREGTMKHEWIASATGLRLSEIKTQALEFPK